MVRSVLVRPGIHIIESVYIQWHGKELYVTVYAHIYVDIYGYSELTLLPTLENVLDALARLIHNTFNVAS